MKQPGLSRSHSAAIRGIYAARASIPPQGYDVWAESARSSSLGQMRVHVDPDKCQGHNRCYAIAPELFDVDELGNAHELNGGEVPAALEEKARMAVANCPEYAIEITE